VALASRVFDALGPAPVVSHRLMADLFLARGVASSKRDDLKGAVADFEQAAMLARTADDPLREASARSKLGTIPLVQGRMGEARAEFACAERILEPVGDPRALVALLCQMSRLYYVQGRLAEARASLERARCLLDDTSDPRLQLIVLSNLAAY